MNDKKTRKRASTRWGPDPDEAGLAIPVGDQAQDVEAEAGQAVADASLTGNEGSAETTQLARRKPKRSRWGPDEEEITAAAGAAATIPVQGEAEAAISQEHRRKPKRSRWGPDEPHEAEANQQPSSAIRAISKSASAKSGKSKKTRWGPDDPDSSAAQEPQALGEQLPSFAAQTAAPSVEVREATAASAVEDALQATGLEPDEATGSGSSAEAAGQLQRAPAPITPAAEAFTLPDGVDPLAAVLLRRRGDPEGTTAATAGAGRPAMDPPSESTSEASFGSAEKAAAEAEAAVSSAGPVTQAAIQPSDVGAGKASTSGMQPATISHVQAMVRVFEAKPAPQLPAPSGQLPWASGTQRAVSGQRPPPRAPPAPDREMALLEEARALAAQAAAEQKAAAEQRAAAAQQAAPQAAPVLKHASQTAAYLASPADTQPLATPQPPPAAAAAAPPPAASAPAPPLLPPPVSSAPAPTQPHPATSQPGADAAAAVAQAADAAGPAAPGAEGAQPAAAADPYGAYGYYGQYGYYAAAAAGDPYAAHYAAAYGNHYDPYTAYSAAAAGYDPYAADAATAEQWAAYYAQASGQTAAAETAEPEVPPGTEDEKPAEEAKPKKEPKVQVVPLPPPSLEPPKVPVRVPKAVRERQEAAAAAAAQREAAAAAAATATKTPDDAQEEAEPSPEDRGVTFLEQPSASGATAPVSKRSGETGIFDKGQPRDLEGRASELGRSPSPSPARSSDRSPPPRKERRHRRANPGSSPPPPRRSHRERSGRGGRRSASPRRSRRPTRANRRSVTPRLRRSPSVQEPRSPSPVESVESGEIPGDPVTGDLPVRSPSRSPDSGPPGRWQESGADRDGRGPAAVPKSPPFARGSGGSRGRRGGRRGGFAGRGAPPDRWDSGGDAGDRWELDGYEGGPLGGSREPDDYTGGYGGGGGGGRGGRGQYANQQGREREGKESYPSTSQGFRSQPMMVAPVVPVPAGPYGIYGGLAAGQLGFGAAAPMGGRLGAFPPMRGRGPRPPPGAPPSGRGRGRW